MVGKAINRRDFLTLSAGAVGTAAAFGLLAACGQEGDRGRLRSRPAPPSPRASRPRRCRPVSYLPACIAARDARWPHGRPAAYGEDGAAFVERNDEASPPGIGFEK